MTAQRSPATAVNKLRGRDRLSEKSSTHALWRRPVPAPLAAAYPRPPSRVAPLASKEFQKCNFLPGGDRGVTSVRQTVTFIHKYLMQSGGGGVNAAEEFNNGRDRTGTIAAPPEPYQLL
ncbi:unnamed protein product, partial [Iphiclides podalirius]